MVWGWRVLRRTVIVIADSTAVPQTSASPIAAWVSPTLNRAPLAATGRYSVVPAGRCLMSMFPPHLVGGRTEWAPGSFGASPIVPGEGGKGGVIWSVKRTVFVAASTWLMFSHGSGNS